MYHIQSMSKECNVIEYSHRRVQRENYKGYNSVRSNKDVSIIARWFIHIKESHTKNQVADQRSATTSS